MKKLFLFIPLLIGLQSAAFKYDEPRWLGGIGFPLHQTQYNHFELYFGRISPMKKPFLFRRLGLSYSLNPNYFHHESTGKWVTGQNPELQPSYRIMFESARLHSKEMDLRFGLQTELKSQDMDFYAGCDIAIGIREQEFTQRQRTYRYGLDSTSETGFWPDYPFDESNYVTEQIELEKLWNYKSYSLKVSVQPFFGWFYDLRSDLRIHVQWSPEITALKHFMGDDNAILYQFEYDWRARLYNFDIMLAFKFMK